jgi:hypothetical protein
VVATFNDVRAVADALRVYEGEVLVKRVVNKPLRGER